MSHPIAPRSIVVLFEGEFDDKRGKFLTALARFSRECLVCVLSEAPTASLRAFVEAERMPIVTSVAALPSGLTEAVIGNLRIDWPTWSLRGRQLVADLVARGITIVNGDHTFLADRLPELAHAIRDLRKFVIDPSQPFYTDDLVARPWQLRVLSAGMDSNIGKMTVSLLVRRALRNAGRTAAFIATGQIGMLLEGDGVPLDALPLDFAHRSVQQLMLKSTDEALVVEGQGSIFHPVFSNSAVTLLHGAAPQLILFCAEYGQTHVRTIPNVRLPRIADAIRLTEATARQTWPASRVCGVTMITRGLDQTEARQALRELEAELGLPVTDVVRFGVEPLVSPILAELERLPRR